MENDIKRQIGWYIITVITTLIPMFTLWFASWNEPALVITVDVLLAATAGLIYYVIKKFFGIPVEEPIVE